MISWEKYYLHTIRGLRNGRNIINTMGNVGNIGFPNVEQMEIHRLVTHKVIGMYCFLGVPIVFSKGSSSSQTVSQDVPKAPHFYPICFGQS